MLIPPAPIPFSGVAVARAPKRMHRGDHVHRTLELAVTIRAVKNTGSGVVLTRVNSTACWACLRDELRRVRAEIEPSLGERPREAFLELVVREALEESTQRTIFVWLNAAVVLDEHGPASPLDGEIGNSRGDL